MDYTREQLSVAEEAILHDLTRRYAERCANYRAMHPEDAAEIIEREEATCQPN